jgi:hypothetical protein
MFGGDGTPRSALADAGCASNDLADGAPMRREGEPCHVV